MVRLVGLTLTALLVAFQLWYTYAPPRQQAWVPDWVRSGANVAAHAIYDASDAVGDVVGPRSKRAWREARVQLGLAERPEEPRTGVMLVGAELAGRSFATRRLEEATFLSARLAGADFTKAYLPRAMFDGATAEDAVFDGAVLEGASMRAARLARARFANADMTAVEAQGAVLAGAELAGADLTRAQLSGADLAGASLKGAKMRSAVLIGTRLSGADLTGVTGLLQDRLDAACGDHLTRLPKGLAVPSCEEQSASAEQWLTSRAR